MMAPAMVFALVAAARAAGPVEVTRELDDVIQARAVAVGVAVPNFTPPTMIAHVGDLDALAFRLRVLTLVPSNNRSLVSWGAVGLHVPPYRFAALQPYVMVHPMNGMVEAGARVIPLDELAVDLQGAYNPKDGVAWGAALLSLGDAKRGSWEAPNLFVMGTAGAGASTRGRLVLRMSLLEWDIRGTFLIGVMDGSIGDCDEEGEFACDLWISALPVGLRLPPAGGDVAWLAYKFHWLPFAMDSRTGVHTVEGNLNAFEYLMFRLAVDVGEGIERRPVRSATLSIGWGSSH